MKSIVGKTLALAGIAGALMAGSYPLYRGRHAGGVIWQPFNMGSIMHARKNNQRNKNQKRMRGFKQR